MRTVAPPTAKSELALGLIRLLSDEGPLSRLDAPVQQLYECPFSPSYDFDGLLPSSRRYRYRRRFVCSAARQSHAAVLPVRAESGGLSGPQSCGAHQRLFGPEYLARQHEQERTR